MPGYLDSRGYHWTVKNRVMHNDDTGVTIEYRPRRVAEDMICGARAMCPGYPNSKKDWRGIDYSQPYEVVCNITGDHAEMPHVGVPADCADMTCRCSAYGSYHLVIVGMSIARLTREAT